MTDNQSRLHGWARINGRVFAKSSSAARLGPRVTRLWQLARSGAPSLGLGIVVAASFLVVETLVVCSLNVLTNTTGCFATIYLLGVLVVPTLWGFGLSATMSVASAVAFSYFRSWPTAHFSPFALEDWAAIAVFILVALVANALASRAREGDRFFDLSPDMLCIADPDRVIRVNPAFKQILGYKLDDVTSRPLVDLIVPDDRDDARALLERLPGGAEPVRFENRVTCNDGSSRWAEWSIAWYRGRFYAVGRDVTERHDARDELIASRARIVTAGDEARRRLERNLHDGAQQRLVSLGLDLRMAQDALPAERTDLRERLSRITSGLTDVSDELREIARGIHPAALSKSGLGPALKTLARRSSIPVTVDATIDRPLPGSIEVAAYYVVAEALTNAAKHACASVVTVCAQTQNANLRLLIRDDGIGGADPSKGSGLVGLKDRVEALGGRINVDSPARSGTALQITIPLQNTCLG